MSAWIAAVVFMIVTVINVLLIFGFPLGELTMGGQHKVLPKPFRIMACFNLLIQIFAIFMVLQAGGIVPLWFSRKATKTVTIILASYLALNTLLNMFSKSKKERYIITPLSTITTVCFFITAFQMK